MPTVIITRPKTAIEHTAQFYKRAGLNVFKAPCFDIKTNVSVKPQWLSAAADIWIILSVHALEHALLIAPDWQPSSTTQVIAVGPAVKKAWRKHFDHQITSHTLMNSEGVIELLQQLKPNSVKIITTGDGRDLIKRYCMQAHISYAQINSYQRIPLAIDLIEMQALYENETHKPVILTATSSGILSQFMLQLADELSAKVLAQPIVVGAQRIADLAKELGFGDIRLADSPSDEAMCEVVNKIVQINKVTT